MLSSFAFIIFLFNEKSRYKRRCAKQIHVSAIHSVCVDCFFGSFVSDEFANTIVVQRGEIHIIPFLRVVAVSLVLHQCCM